MRRARKTKSLVRYFVVYYPFAISLICLGFAYLLDHGFRSFSGLIGPNWTRAFGVKAVMSIGWSLRMKHALLPDRMHTEAARDS